MTSSGASQTASSRSRPASNRLLVSYLEDFLSASRTISLWVERRGGSAKCIGLVLFPGFVWVSCSPSAFPRTPLGTAKDLGGGLAPSPIAPCSRAAPPPCSGAPSRPLCVRPLADVQTGANSPCVGAGATLLRLLYDNIPVSDQNWAIRVNIGLSGGDITQFVWYDWFVIDNAISAEVARARASVFYWVEVGADIEAHTLTAHIGGTVDVGVTIHNLDSNSQCFNLLTRAAWW